MYHIHMEIMVNKGEQRSLAFGKLHAQGEVNGGVGGDSTSGTHATTSEWGKTALKEQEKATVFKKYLTFEK